MNKLTRSRPKVKKQTAASWPAWTDEVAFYPTDTDKAENAATNESYDSEPDDAYWDDRAGEALALDQLERGLRMF